MRSHPNFPNPIDGKFCPKGRQFVLDTDFIYQDEEVRVIVPAGFVTDFNSVPEPLWAYFAPWEHPEAGTVHDWLYRNPGGRSRQQVDAVHRRILELKGMRPSKRQAIYLALRLGGWKPWNKYRALDMVLSDPSNHKSSQNPPSSLDTLSCEPPRKVGKQVYPGTR